MATEAQSLNQRYVDEPGIEALSVITLNAMSADRPVLEAAVAFSASRPSEVVSPGRGRGRQAQGRRSMKLVSCDRTV
jgi:hypothetical protein